MAASYHGFRNCKPPKMGWTIGMTTAGTNGVFPVSGSSAYCPFEASDVVVRRVFVSGVMNTAGHGSVLVSIRGYMQN